MESEAVARVHKAILRADGGTAGQARAAIAMLFDWLESRADYPDPAVVTLPDTNRNVRNRFLKNARKEALGDE